MLGKQACDVLNLQSAKLNASGAGDSEPNEERAEQEWQQGQGSRRWLRGQIDTGAI